MKKITLITVILISLILPALAKDSNPQVIIKKTITPSISNEATSNKDITVIVENFRNNSGQVVVGLYNSADGFPFDPQKARRIVKTNIENNKAEVVFKNIPPGVYAISAIHDENQNGKLDTNFFLIPQEGYATSNNAQALFGAPSFDDAKFSLGDQSLTPQIRIRY